jgi:uncharacterized protein YoxC
MFITIILITCCIVWLATLIVFVYLRKKRKKDQFNLPVHLKAYEKAMKEMDIDGINHFGSLVLWNENTLHEQKVLMLNSIKSLVENHPDLQALHKEAHYLVNGMEAKEEIL